MICLIKSVEIRIIIRIEALTSCDGSLFFNGMKAKSNAMTVKSSFAGGVLNKVILAKCVASVGGAFLFM